ncbi:MAG TPA: Mpo1-like protein [Burkholderiaceae bacterium]|jgi:uncharacterized membrane protein YGL010W|nr:Mpo1-like protein [Burkholderiaceae bacterium]
MARPFRPATELMVQYARYHRDRRNIATHFLGIPLIVFAVGVFFGRARFEVDGSAVTCATVLWLAAALWYITRGHLLLGAATSAATGVLVALAHPFADGSTATWLASGSVAFVTGWVLQFIGHYYEGRKPAFVDDLVGLLVGPMFVAGEALFALGLCRPLADEIERATGPTRLRDLAHPAS